MSSPATPDSAAWAAALGRIPSGLVVLTARNGDTELAMLASWVQQCSFEPLSVSAAVAKARPLSGWLTRDDTPVVMNVIPEGNKALMAHFGKGFEPGEPAFTGISVDREAASAPVLTDAAAFLECRVSGWTDANDHTLFVLEVVGGRTLSDARPAVHVRKSASHY